MNIPNNALKQYAHEIDATNYMHVTHWYQQLVSHSQVKSSNHNRPFQNYQSTDGTKRYVVSPKIVPFDSTPLVPDSRKRTVSKWIILKCLFVLLVVYNEIRRIMIKYHEWMYTTKWTNWQFKTIQLKRSNWSLEEMIICWHNMMH